jgi:iron(II)-dependent oxidoreductase
MTDAAALTRADHKADLVAELAAARRRTLALLEPLSDDFLTTQHSPLMSPLSWDLAHIGVFEELWLLQQIAGTEPMVPEYAGLYDAFSHPRIERAELGLMSPEQARRYLAEVRERSLEVLARCDLDDPDEALLAGGFVYRMVIQHEHQHCETMLATLQLSDVRYPLPAASAQARSSAPDQPRDVLIDAGPFELGTSDDPWAYDNERPAHDYELPAFRIDTMPVTNGEYLQFVEAGGYDDERGWSPEGWRWR